MEVVRSLRLPPVPHTTGDTMTSADPIAHIAVHGLQLTYSAREAAVPLGRSYSWLDQRLRKGDFILPDGMIMQPLRTAGGTGGSLWRCSKTSP